MYNNKFATMLVTLVAFLGLSVAPAFAQTNATTGANVSANATAEAAVELEEKPGLLPDSPLYGIGRFFEGVQEFFTFSDEGKAELKLKFAERRLAEAKAMIEAKKIDVAAKVREEHAKTLQEAQERFEKVRTTSAKEEFAKVIAFEKKIERQDDYVKQVIDQQIKVKVEGELTAEQKAALEAMIKAFGNSTANIEIKIKNKKDRVKERLKAELNVSDEDILENEIELETQFEAEVEAKKLGIARASEAIIAVADRMIAEARETLAKWKAENVTCGEVEAAVSTAADLSTQAKAALAAGNETEAKVKAQVAVKTIQKPDLWSNCHAKVAEVAKRKQAELQERLKAKITESERAVFELELKLRECVQQASAIEDKLESIDATEKCYRIYKAAKTVKEAVAAPVIPAQASRVLDLCVIKYVEQLKLSKEDAKTKCEAELKAASQVVTSTNTTPTTVTQTTTTEKTNVTTTETKTTNTTNTSTASNTSSSTTQ